MSEGSVDVILPGGAFCEDVWSHMPVSGGGPGGGQLPQQLVRKPWPLRQNTRAETRELKLRTLSVISHAEIPSASSGVGGLVDMSGSKIYFWTLQKKIASPPVGVYFVRI